MSLSNPIEAELAKKIQPLKAQRVLIGLDVDGTLVDHDAKMSSRVEKALHQVREAGHELVIATGRSLGSTLPIVKQAGVSEGWCVSSNGAVTVKITAESAKVVKAVTFNPSEALNSLKDVVPTARFAVELPDGSFLATKSFQDASFGIEAQYASIDQLLKQTRVLRVVVTAPDMDSDEFHQVVAAAGVRGCEYAIGWSNWIDMSPPGVTKARALEELRVELGISKSQTLAIGDGSNDVDMLSWAQVGVAMGQAKAHVVASADLQTTSITADGAALALEQLL